MKFPREQIEPEWVISVKYLKDLKSKIENQIPIKYISDLDLEDIEAVLLALEIADNPKALSDIKHDKEICNMKIQECPFCGEKMNADPQDSATDVAIMAAVRQFAVGARQCMAANPLLAGPKVTGPKGPQGPITEKEIIDSIAKATHEINRIYCLHLGDISQSEWADAPQWQKESAREGILAILENPKMMPDDQHALWMAEKLKNGWIYGKEKNEENKTHPCLVPYEQLPFAQRAKDMIFGSVVRGLASHFGLIEEDE